MTKNLFIFLVIATPLLIVGAGCSTNSNQTNSGDPTFDGSKAVTSGSSNDDSYLSADIIPGATVVKTSNGVYIANPTLDYVNALAIYQKSGARIQFANCSGNPGQITIKKSAKFMIDNRDNEAHKIVISTKTYQLSAYDFAIVSVAKAGTYNITCDGGGSSQIIVQN